MIQALIPYPEIDPVIFSIPLGVFDLALRWYALAYIGGLLLAWFWVVRLVKNTSLWAKGKPPMTAKQPEDLLTWVILGVIIGGRLGFVIFYQPAYFLDNPLEIPQVWLGGMAFHGGFLGVVTACFLYARKNGLSVAGVGDCLAVTVPIGLFLGRLANFIRPELWGRPTDLPWAIVFPDSRALTCPEGWVGVCSRHPSQLYEAGLEGLLLGLVMTWLVYRRGWLKIPGQMIGVFFVGYGLSRALIELFRQADPQFASDSNPLGHVIRFGTDITSWGLTMGQTLSIPMALIGLLIVWQARRRA